MLDLIHGLWRAQSADGLVYWFTDRTAAALWLACQTPVSTEIN